MSFFDSIPQEVLEHIAFFAATSNFLGPPSDLIPLLASSRRIYAQLSITANPHLYARVFSHKFDLQPAFKRLGAEYLTPTAISAELRDRFIYLKRIRARRDAYRTKGGGSQATLHQLLLRPFAWLLENEDKNERQLREYAKIDCWLHEYWFNYNGASNAIRLIQDDKWPTNDQNTTLAMWLYWILLKPDGHRPNDNTLDVLGAFALAAHKYSISTLSWTEFFPSSSDSHAPSRLTHFDRDLNLTPLPVAIPAILSFLTLVNKPSSSSSLPHSTSSLKSSVRVKPSSEWDTEWVRCQLLSQVEHDTILTNAFKPGSVEGVWEGQFTYTEFTSYAALLGGAAPHVLQKSVVARHQQTWKLREYHLFVSDVSHSDFGIDLDMGPKFEPLPAGDPLRSHFPSGTHIKEDREGLTVLVPHQSGSIRYQRATRTALHAPKRNSTQQVADVIIMGEGHSSWGQFNLIGRVRPCDGFISLSKEYVDGDRGRWLYRAYLVGGTYGNLAGRWRDTLSPPDVLGYEGCFALSRRR